MEKVYGHPGEELSENWYRFRSLGKPHLYPYPEPEKQGNFIGFNFVVKIKGMGMEVQHDRRQRKFFTLISDTEYSLEYNEIEPALWEFHCSFISTIGPKVDEREIRDKLIEYAIYYMSRNGIQMFESGSCSQVREFLDKKKNFDYLIKYINK